MRSDLAKKMVSIVLLLLTVGVAAPRSAAGVAGVVAKGAPGLADVDLDEVPVGRALRLLAETYDVSIATGALPDTKVTVRLRGIGADEAFAAVAAAAGLEVVREGGEGAVVRLVPKSADAAARQVVPAVFSAGTEAGLAGLHEAGVEAHRIGQGGLLLEGRKNAVEAAALALGNARQHQVTDRVYPLGVAPGEETLKAVQPLLEPHLEVATYNAVENQLTVSALPATLARVDALLGELTRTPKQYEIEVQVVEVSKNALRQMGSQGTFGLDIRGGVLASTFPLAGLNAAKRYLPSANDLAALSRFGTAGGVTAGSGDPGSLADPGFRFGQIDARGIGLMIQALEQSGEARVMATPRVTALDNRRARISMVTTLRIPTFTQNQAFATTTVTGIEQVDVGTTLEVRPRHGAGKQILLTVSPEVSELQPNNSAVTQNGLTQGLPVVTRRRTETEVVLESGETLIIGGLVTEHKTETHGRTPGLASLPLIGRAFRLEGKQSENTELLVFVTPRELPSPEARKSKVRIGETWLPFALAAELEGARTQLHGQAAADRVAGLRSLERIDADLLAAEVDSGRDVAALGGTRASTSGSRRCSSCCICGRRRRWAIWRGSRKRGRWRSRRSIRRWRRWRRTCARRWPSSPGLPDSRPLGRPRPPPAPSRRSPGAERRTRSPSRAMRPAPGWCGRRSICSPGGPPTCAISWASASPRSKPARRAPPSIRPCAAPASSPPA